MKDSAFATLKKEVLDWVMATHKCIHFAARTVEDLASVFCTFSHEVEHF